LDPEKIEVNPGRRAVAKICLNSLWGKFGQRQNMSQTEYVTSVQRFYEVLLDDRLTDINVNYLTDEMAQMSYKFKDHYVENNTSTNIYIALFTTANARLRLYKKLDKLNEAVIYCDTDSIVYFDDGENTVKTGDMLGEWTDELEKDDYIKLWASTGPKSYYYETKLGKKVTKIKGFTLNHQNLEKTSKFRKKGKRRKHFFKERSKGRIFEKEMNYLEERENINKKEGKEEKN
jgi:hypothetical protein